MPALRPVAVRRNTGKAACGLISDQYAAEIIFHWPLMCRADFANQPGTRRLPIEPAGPIRRVPGSVLDRNETRLPMSTTTSDDSGLFEEVLPRPVSSARAA